MVTEIQLIPPALPDDVPLSGKDRGKLESAMTGDEAETGEWTRLHPGEVLLKEFLEPLGIGRRRLARELRVSPRRIGDLVRGKSAVTLDTGLRLAVISAPPTTSGSGCKWTMTRCAAASRWERV